MSESAAAPAAPEVPAAPAAGSPAVPAKPTEPFRTYKVGDKTFEVLESKIDERVAKSFGAEEAMKQRSEMERALSNFVSQARDPEQLLNLLNHPAIKYDDAKQEMLVTKMLSSKSPRIVAAVKKWIYDNEIEPETLTPEQRKIRELERYKSDKEQRELQEADRRKQADEEAAVKQAKDTFRVKISEGLKVEGLPFTEATVVRVARYGLLYSKQGKPVDISDCCRRVKADLIAEYNERFEKATDEEILSSLPENVVKKINAAYLKKLKPTAKVIEKNDARPERKERKDVQGDKARAMFRAMDRGRFDLV